MTNNLFELIAWVMPRRHASIVEQHMNDIGVSEVSDLRGFAIPATFATDLRGIAATHISRLEKVLQEHGARLVK